MIFPKYIFVVKNNVTKGKTLIHHQAPSPALLLSRLGLYCLVIQQIQRKANCIFSFLFSEQGGERLQSIRCLPFHARNITPVLEFQIEKEINGPG